MTLKSILKNTQKEKNYWIFFNSFQTIILKIAAANQLMGAYGCFTKKNIRLFQRLNRQVFR